MYRNKRLSLIFFVVLPFLLIFTYFIKTLILGFNWPSVESEVVFSQIKEEEDGKYSVKILYEFNVGDKPYRGRSLEFSKYDKEETQSIIDSYPVGKKITAYYNPDNLYESTSEINNKYQSFSLLRIISMFAYLFGFIRSYLVRIVIAVLIIYVILALAGKITKTKQSFYISLIGAVSVSSVATTLLILGLENLNLVISSTLFSVLALYLVLNRIGTVSVKQSAVVSVAFGVIDVILYFSSTILFYLVLSRAF